MPTITCRVEHWNGYVLLHYHNGSVFKLWGENRAKFEAKFPNVQTGDVVSISATNLVNFK